MTGWLRYAVIIAAVVIGLILLQTLRWTCSTTSGSSSCGFTVDTRPVASLFSSLAPTPAPAPAPTSPRAPVTPTVRSGGLKPLILD
jgi:hypothetical protein